MESRAIVVTHKGLEEFCASELKKFDVDGVSRAVVVEFNCDDEKLFEISYKSQTIIKAIRLLKSGKVSGLSNFVFEWQDWLSYAEIKLKCKIIDNEQFTVPELEEDISSKIVEPNNAKVNLKNPNLIFYLLVVKEDYYFGIDFSGDDLSKRDYKIFNTNTSIKGTLAACLLTAAEFDAKKSLLDPMCNNGIIIIESALMGSKISHNFFTKDNLAFLRIPKFKDFDFNKFFAKHDKSRVDKLEVYGYDSLLKNVKASQKNAQIAGVHKLTFFSRVEQKWIDFKFTKNEIDIVATVLPGTSRTVTIEELEIIYKEFFYQAEYIVKKKGVVAVLTDRADITKKYAEEFKLNLTKDTCFQYGDKKNSILVFSK